MDTKLRLRVNGINIAKATVRRKLTEGSPLGETEVVIEVPAVVSGLPPVGEISINGNEGVASGLPKFVVEIKKNELDRWMAIDPKTLADILTTELLDSHEAKL